MATRLFRGERSRPDREQLVNDKRAMQAHSTNHSQMGNATSGKEVYTVEYLEKILPDQNDLEPETVQLVSTLLNKDWVLSQFQDAEVKEFKWLKRALKKKIAAMHPPEGSPIQGEYRKFLFDDDGDALSALTQKQRHDLDQLFLLAFANDPRSRGGWQQEQIGKSVQVSEYRDNQKQESKGLFSFR